MNYLNYLKQTTEQTVVSSARTLPKDSGISTSPEINIPQHSSNLAHSKETLEKINESISDISSTMGINKNLDENLIKKSSLNDILDYTDYQEFMKNIKNFIIAKYGDIWFAQDLDNLNLYSDLLSNVSDIINEVFPSNGKFSLDNYREDIILEKLANLYFGLFLIFLHEDDEMSVYSLLNSYIKLSEDPKFQRDKGILFSNAWDTLVLPISIKQHHLVLIKLLDFWFGIGGSWESLKKRIQIKLLKEK